MKLRNRFALVISGVIIFLIVTPILVIYAGGFRVDWENYKLIKTGAIVVKTQPTKAEIFLNNEKIDDVTPANIRFVAPGDYDIRIQKDGYQSWTKRLSVRSQLVTWANFDRDFVTMFLTHPTNEKSWNGTSIAINEDEITFLENLEPTRVNIQNGDSNKIQSLPQAPVENTVKQITDILTSYNIPVPAFTIGKIIRAENQIYLILDQNLYLINERLEKIYSPVTEAHWNSDSAELLIANNNEIFIHNPDTRNSDLILRSLTPLQNPVLNPETGFIFFQNEGLIKAVEIDGRDHRNIFTIADALDNFALSKDGKKLYTISKSEINEFTIR